MEKIEKQYSKFLTKYYIRGWVLFLLLIVFLVNSFSHLSFLKWPLYFLMLIQLTRSIKAAYHIEKLALLFSKREEQEYAYLQLPKVRIEIISVLYYIGLIFNILLLYNIYKNNLFWSLFLLLINFFWDYIFSMASKNHLDDNEDYYNNEIKFDNDIKILHENNNETPNHSEGRGFKNNKELVIQKNKTIKYFLFLNIAFYLLIFILPEYSWLNEVIALSLIVFFVFKYSMSRNKIAGHIEYNINVATKEKSLALFEIYAGTIIGQIFVLIIVFSFRLIFLSTWIKLLLWIPLFFIAVVFGEEYKKNKKLIENKTHA